jgi:xanthine dehydrogenase accessory factor
MFVTEEGQAAGVLSRGCLERDVRERAEGVMRTNKPVVVKYDTTTDEEIIWGLGLGCNGVVHVLIERAAGERMDEFIGLLAECTRGRQCGAVATVFGSTGNTEATVGGRALLYPDGTCAG